MGNGDIGSFRSGRQVFPVQMPSLPTPAQSGASVDSDKLKSQLQAVNSDAADRLEKARTAWDTANQAFRDHPNDKDIQQTATDRRNEFDQFKSDAQDALSKFGKTNEISAIRRGQGSAEVSDLAVQLKTALDKVTVPSTTAPSASVSGYSDPSQPVPVSLNFPGRDDAQMADRVVKAKVKQLGLVGAGGENQADVTKLQQLLKLTPATPGKMDGATRAAILDYQTKNNLLGPNGKPDGIVGAQTWSSLLSQGQTELAYGVQGLRMAANISGS